jgi:hypothetical protein
MNTHGLASEGTAAQGASPESIHGMAQLPRVSLAKVPSRNSAVFVGIKASITLSPITWTTLRVDAARAAQSFGPKLLVSRSPSPVPAFSPKGGLVQSSPNKSLQRSGTHKVLGRGRPSVVFLRALARPRASAAAAGR